MFIRLFRSGEIIIQAFIPLVGVILWLPSFFTQPESPVCQPGVLTELFPFLFRESSWVGALSACILAILQALYFNYISSKHELLKKNSSLPGLCYLLMVGASSQQQFLYTSLVANSFILLALQRVLDTYRQEKAYGAIFDSSVLIGIAGLAYPAAFYFFPLIWVSLIVIRPFIWREWVISVLGVFVPVFIVSSLLWLYTDYLLMGLLPQLHFHPAMDFPLNTATVCIVCVIAITYLLTFGRLMQGLNISSIRAKNNLQVLIWLFVIAAALLFFQPKSSIRDFSFLLIPISIFSANYFLNAQKLWLAESLFLLLLGAVMANVW